MKIKNQILRFAAFVLVALSVFSCSESDKNEVTRLPTAIGYFRANTAKYSILLDALKKTGLETQLDGAGSFTIFAPDNTDFAAINLSSAQINALTAPADNVAIANLRVILLNHVMGVGTRSSDLLSAGYSKTLGFYRSNAPVPVAGQTGIITANNTNLMSIFVNQVGSDVLLNGGVANGGAKVTNADIDVSNGVIHEIDAVLTLPTLVNHLVANPRLSTLVSVVTSTGGAFGNQSAVFNVFNTATNSSARTLFAPNNDAFTTATGAGGFLVGQSTANITKILQYHYLSATGARLRAFFTPLPPPATPVDFFFANTAAATNQTFGVTTAGTLGNRIEDNAVAPRSKVARFVTNDIVCVNGIIHIIDKVLEPTLP
jgi:uncharacterized surface protein with fasciclin (FAS1) repeats